MTSAGFYLLGSGQASNGYNKHDIDLKMVSWKITSSESLHANFAIYCVKRTLKWRCGIDKVAFEMLCSDKMKS